jgi:radical SAM protein (TIGR01212 family)
MVNQRARYRSYSAYLRQKYGRPVYRVAVDAGFSCPNRGPGRSAPGCVYCDEHGARAPYQGPAAGMEAPGKEETASRTGSKEDIRRQVRRGVDFLKSRYKAECYLLYFQAFSSTYAPPDRLKSIYDYTLGLEKFRELIISTRPDCVDQKRAELLASYLAPNFDVWVELGLQSAHDPTLKRIRRGHTVADFERAYRLLKSCGVKLAVHLIFGLPGEGLAEMLETVRFAAALQPDGVKIHNLHIPTGSPLFRDYLRGELSAPCAARHLDTVCRALELLPPETVIMRLTCDTPAHRLACPRHFSSKADFYHRVARELEVRNIRQGDRFRGASRNGGPDR